MTWKFRHRFVEFDLGSGCLGLMTLLLASVGCTLNGRATDSESPNGYASILEQPLERSCVQCMGFKANGCSSTPIVPMVAIVHGARTTSNSTYCLDGPMDVPVLDRICFSKSKVRFRTVRFVRKPTTVEQVRSFEATSSFLEERNPVQHRQSLEETAQGINLKSDSRYLIFASDQRSNAGRLADWKIEVACEMHPTTNGEK